jgi:hypothetical protein
MSQLVAANSSITARVAVYNPHRKSAGHLHRVSARAGGGDDRDSSPRASILSITVNLPANQSVAVLPTSGNVIAAGLPRLRKLAARVLERGGPLSCARTLAAAFTRRRRDIRPGFVNFCRTILAAGKPSLRIPFVDHCSEPSNSIANIFVFPPVPVLSLVTVHTVNLAKDEKHEEPKSRGL